MSKDEEHYAHRTITLHGELVEGERKPVDWAVHFWEVCDDGQWAKMTYRFEGRVNPDISLKQASNAIEKLRSDADYDDDVRKRVDYLEKQIRNRRRFITESLFTVTG